MYTTDKNYAKDADKNDPLREFRNRFHIPRDKDRNEVIYLCGNSLGLQPFITKAYVEQELEDWKNLGVEGHLHAQNPWLPYHEFLTEKTAALAGAENEEVVNMNSLTVNLHLMMVSFYRPTNERYKILIEGNCFPSDHYAVQSQIRFHGFGVADALIEAKPREGESITRMDDILEIIDREGDKIALIMIAGVNYYSGQLFDMKGITEAGHKKGCIVGFDLAHAIGNVPLYLHDWDVDFAVWCNYKYMNGGPGAIGGAFINKKHVQDATLPKFLGWWGHDKGTRFLMDSKYIPIPTAESWQLSNPPIFQLAALKASLDVFYEANIEKLREKSVQLTGYMEYLINEKNKEHNNLIEIITPANPDARGCQLSLRAKENGKIMHDRLIKECVFCDWREPDVIRVAPVPLYNTFEDVYCFVEILFKQEKN
ncbi:MAG TPA: kynureninase [Ignavibacteria bacterium]|nr:kynureninase [Ignavibacteria bacterium]